MSEPRSECFWLQCTLVTWSLSPPADGWVHACSLALQTFSLSIIIGLQRFWVSGWGMLCMPNHRRAWSAGEVRGWIVGHQTDMGGEGEGRGLLEPTLVLQLSASVGEKMRLEQPLKLPHKVIIENKCQLSSLPDGAAWWWEISSLWSSPPTWAVQGGGASLKPCLATQSGAHTASGPHTAGRVWASAGNNTDIL